MRAYRDQHLHLDPTRKEVNASITVSKLFGYRDSKSNNNNNNDDDDDDDNNDDIMRKVFTLKDAERKRAIEYARWFNHDPNADPSPLMVKYAERMIWQKSQPKKTKAGTTASETSVKKVKKTIHISPEIDGWIQHVAKKNHVSYNKAYEELTTVGLADFKKLYELK